ncbi:MAG: hypothetical protein ACO1QR_15390 [Chthoniobacteraceae bacterium]
MAAISMGDLKNPRIIKLKGLLFLLLGVLSSVLLLLPEFSVRNALLLAIAVWSFCRFYYFAFYVIEHYVDPQYRFAGLADFAKYMVRRKIDGGTP